MRKFYILIFLMSFTTLLCAQSSRPKIPSTAKEKEKKERKISVEGNYNFSASKPEYDFIYSQGLRGSLDVVRKLSSAGVLDATPFIYRMDLGVTGLIEQENGSMQMGPVSWRGTIIPEYIKRKIEIGEYDFNSRKPLSAADMSILSSVIENLTGNSYSTNYMKSVVAVTDLFSSKNNIEVISKMRDISAQFPEEKDFLSFVSGLENLLYADGYGKPKLHDPKFNVYNVVNTVRNGKDGSELVCRHFARFTQTLLEQSGRYPNTYIHSRNNHTVVLTQTQDGRMANISDGYIAPLKGNMANAYDNASGPYATHAIYGAGGKILAVFDAPFGQLVRAAAGDTGYEPFACSSVPNHFVARVDGSALLIGETGTGLQSAILVLGKQKDLENFQASYGLLGTYSRSREGDKFYGGGARGAVKYKSGNKELFKGVEGRLEARADAMAHVYKDPTSNYSVGGDLDINIEIKSVAEIGDVCGGTLSVELAAHAVPTSPKVAEYSVLRTTTPFINNVYGGAGYKKEIDNTEYFSQFIAGTIAKSAYLHTSAGMKRSINNEDELLVVVGYITPTGNFNPILKPLAEVYVNAGYKMGDFQLSLGAHKPTMLYPGVKSTTEITVNTKYDINTGTKKERVIPNLNIN
ncbi:hypothetical protein Dip510_001490 [Elusimicrobium posterum]|uniref:hypothetical protein n=1 Tax=Elusimicrobium posterum TaxID=3116653 RepID=UPI003C734F6B